MRNEVRKYKYKKSIAPVAGWGQSGRFFSDEDPVNRGNFFPDEDPVNRGVFFRMKIPSIGTKFFPHAQKIEKHSHNFDQNIRQKILVTKYSHNSPDFCKPSSERARIYKCQAEREAGKQKHF